MDFATVYCCRSNSAYHTSFTSRSNLKATITEVISAYNTSFIETYPYRDDYHSFSYTTRMSQSLLSSAIGDK